MHFCAYVVEVWLFQVSVDSTVQHNSIEQRDYTLELPGTEAVLPGLPESAHALARHVVYHCDPALTP